MVWKVPIPTNLEEELGGDKKLMMLFIWLILHASNKQRTLSTKKGVIDIDIGQVHISKRKLSEYFDCSPTTIVVRLQKLSGKFSKIVVDCVQGLTIITIVDYFDLVGFEKIEGPKGVHNKFTTSPTRDQEQERKEGEDGIDYISTNSLQSSEPLQASPPVYGFIEAQSDYHQVARPLRLNKAKYLSEQQDAYNKLISLDGYTEEQLNYTLKWIVQDDFWRSNAVSIVALRKKKDGLKKIDKIFDRIKEEYKKNSEEAQRFIPAETYD